MNDISILWTIVLCLALVGVVTPFLNSDFGAGASSHNFGGVVDDAGSSVGSGTLSIWNVLLSVVSMFLWSFGAIPWWLDLAVFEPMRIMGYFIIARNIWIGGGG